MDEITPRYPAYPASQQAMAPRPASQGSLVDVLDRVLDKGLVIAGDIAVNLLDIELLTIKVRLVIASVDKAKEMGIDWWQRDPQLSSDAAGTKGGGNGNGRGKADANSRLLEENRMLRERLARLESKVNADAPPSGARHGATGALPARRGRTTGG